MDSVQTSKQQGRVADAPSGHWTYRLLPRSAWPYAQLARWDRPIGCWLLVWPCWWSTALVLGPLTLFTRGMTTTIDNATATDVWIDLILGAAWYLILFFIGAVAMRGAGCTYNDLVDQKIDDQVARTRSRPLPSGQVTRFQAKVFLVAQALLGLVVLLQFNQFAILLGLSSLVVVVIYPFMKRVTDWPQLFLGLAFSWGALMGWAALTGTLSWPPLILYAGCILWTIGYDTIYAHQDKEDDAIVGVRSTARLFGVKTKQALVALYGLMIVLFAVAFFISGAAWPAYLGLALAGLHLARQVIVLDIDNGDQCLALFKSNSTIGWLIFIGLLVSSLWHYMTFG